MSTRMKSLLVVALMLAAVVSAIANDGPNAGLAIMPVRGSGIFKVIYKSETFGKVKVNLYDTQHRLMYSETVKADGFILPLDFNGLTAGVYTVELIDAAGKKTEKIDYQPAQDRGFVHVAKLTEENKYLVSVANSKSSDKISVNIYDSSNTLLHQEERVVAGDFAQLYTVKGAYNGLTFIISDSQGSIKTVSF